MSRRQRPPAGLATYTSRFGGLAASWNPYALQQSSATDVPLFYSTTEGCDRGPQDEDSVVPTEEEIGLSGQDAEVNPGFEGGAPGSEHGQGHGTEGLWSGEGAQHYRDDEEDPFHSGEFAAPGRHQLAAHALSAMMASELADAGQPSPLQAQQPPPYGSHYGSPAGHLAGSLQADLRNAGWKLYQTERHGGASGPLSAQGRIRLDYGGPPGEETDSEPPSEVARHPTDPPLCNPTPGPSAVPPAAASQPQVALLKLSHSVTEPPQHPLLRPRPPELAPSSYARKPPPGGFPDDDATVATETERVLYIYPSEARDNASARPGFQGYRDPGWLVLWMVSLVWVAWQALWLAVWAPSSPAPGPSAPDDDGARQPKLLATLPLLALLTTLSLAFGSISVGYLLLVKSGVRHVVRGVLAGVPLSLALIGLWTWSASFSGGSQGALDPAALRWIGLACVVLAYCVARAVWARRHRVERTIKVLELCGTVVLAHPPLLVACGALSLVFTLATLPFFSLIYRLLLVGRYAPGAGPGAGGVWEVDPAAVWRAIGVTFIWVWSLGVLRGVQKITVAGVVASWYFNRHSPDHPGPLDLTASSLSRAAGPSLGTLCAAAFLSALFDSAAYVLRKARDWTRKASGYRELPIWMAPIGWVAPLAAVGAGLMDVVNAYAVVWAGVTGEPFGASSYRVTGLLARNGTVGLADNLLVKLMLNLTSFTLSVLASLVALFGSRYTVTDASLAPLVALCCGVVPFWTIRFVSDLVANAADTVFCCWNIDLDGGTNHSAKAQEAFGTPANRGRSRV